MHEQTASLGAQRTVAVAGTAALLLGWGWLAQGLPDYVLPGPVEVAKSTLRFFVEPALLAHVGVSFVRVVISVVLAMTLALLIASVVRRFPIMDETVERRILTFFNAFPSVGWAILGVIWFQISTPTVIFVQVAIILPFCLISALSGFRQIDPEMDELGHSLTRMRWRRFRLLSLPLVAPFVASGLRVACGICWKSVSDANMVFACCVVIVLIFGATDRLFLKPLESRFSKNR